MAQNWTDLSQEEKFDIMRDYVRRGFHNLDDIMNDYNAQQYDAWEKKSDPEQPYKTNPSMQAVRDVLRDMYGIEE